MKVLICTGDTMFNRVRGEIIRSSLSKYFDKGDVICRQLNKLLELTTFNDKWLYNQIVYTDEEFLIIFDERAIQEYQTIDFSDDDSEVPQILFTLKAKVILALSEESNNWKKRNNIIVREVPASRLENFLTIEVGYKCKRIFDFNLMEETNYYMRKREH